MKNKVRQEMKQRRSELSLQYVEEKSILASRAFINSNIFKNANNLMLYMPLGKEISTLEIIKNSFLKGKTVILPITDRDTYEISAHKITQETQFKKGVFSLTEPKEKSYFEKNKIDTVIVPGVAFDKKGSRIGFGKGCYDKFLEGLICIKIGFCYDFQITDEIEADFFDIKMDYLLTESGLIKCHLD